MWFSRAVLGLTGFIFAAYGIYCAFAPQTVAPLAGYSIANNTGVIEFIAMYGGLQLAFGIVLLYSACAIRWILPGLALLAICTLCLATTRAVGISLHGADGYNSGALAYETITAALAMLGWLLQRKQITV